MATRLLRGLFKTLVRAGYEYIKQHKREHTPIDARISHIEQQIATLFWWKQHMSGVPSEGWVACICPACICLVKVPENLCDYCESRQCV